jgi:MFS family permease
MIENREDLANAIALNSSMVNAARLVGPAIAGIVIAAVGEGYCFLIDGLSYVAVIASLLFMRITPETPQITGNRVHQDLTAGWQYVSTFVPIRSILLLLGIVSLAGMPYTVLMPVLATRVLEGGPHTLGYLMAASGVGALAGAITMAMRKSVLGLGSHIVMCSALLGVSLIALSLSHNLWLSLLLIPFVGFAMMQQLASSNTILQTIVDDEKRGRVMSFYSMAFQGMAPFGSLMAGALAARVGVLQTLAISGVICILGSIWFSRQLRVIRPLIRPIYVRLGILPEAATGVQHASALQTPPQQ